jgi:hypothetical protein
MSRQRIYLFAALLTCFFPVLPPLGAANDDASSEASCRVLIWPCWWRTTPYLRPDPSFYWRSTCRIQGASHGYHQTLSDMGGKYLGNESPLLHAISLLLFGPDSNSWSTPYILHVRGSAIYRRTLPLPQKEQGNSTFQRYSSWSHNYLTLNISMIIHESRSKIRASKMRRSVIL